MFKKYLIGFSLVSSLLLVGCTSEIEQAPKDNISDENVVKDDNTSTTKDTNNNAPKDTSVDDIIVEGFGSVKEGLNKKFGYSDEQFKEIKSQYSIENYDYNKVIPGETEKISFYQKNAVVHGEEKSQAEDTYLIYFFSPLCTYCNDFYSTLVDYEKQENAYPLYRLNVDILDNYFVWDAYEIKGTPTLVLYDKKNDKIINKFSGVQPLDSIPTVK